MDDPASQVHEHTSQMDDSASEADSPPFNQDDPAYNVDEQTDDSASEEFIDAQDFELDLQNEISHTVLENSLEEMVRSAFNKLSQNDVAAAMIEADQAIKKASENPSNWTPEVRKKLVELHMLKFSCYSSSRNMIESMKEIDCALETSILPIKKLIDTANTFFGSFCKWMYACFSQHKVEIFEYFKTKQACLSRMQNSGRSDLSIIVAAKQCSFLAQQIRKLDSSLVKTSEIVELLTLHGILCFNSPESFFMQDFLKTLINDAMGYGCRNARLHWLAGSFEMREVELQMAFPIYMNNDRFAKKLNEVKYHASAGLELSPQDPDLLKLKDRIDSEIESFIDIFGEKAVEPVPFVKPLDDMEMVQQVERQQENARKRREEFELNKQKKSKSKTPVKYVTRDRTQMAPDADMKSGETEVVIGNKKPQQNSKLMRKGIPGIEPVFYCRAPDGTIRETDADGKIKGGAMRLNGTNSDVVKQKSREKRESAQSLKVYFDLIREQKNIMLGCDICYVTAKTETGFKTQLRSMIHKCKENQLLVSEKSQSKEYMLIRNCPRRFKISSEMELCENYLNGEECMEKEKCANPHNEVEKRLWTKYFKKDFDVEKFVADLRDTSLRIKYDIQKICRSQQGTFDFVCKTCFEESMGKEACYKKNHAPFCSKKPSPHKWKGNEKLVFIRNGMASNVVDLELSGESLLAGWVSTLLERGIKKNQIVEESRKLKQKLGSGCTKERIRDDSLSSGISSLAPSINTEKEESESDFEEDPERIYDDDLDDLMSVCSSSDQESEEDFKDDDDNGYSNDSYYSLKPEKELRKLLLEEPWLYKRCTIHLEGPGNAKCKFLDADDSEVIAPRQSNRPKTKSDGFDIVHQRNHEEDEQEDVTGNDDGDRMLSGELRRVEIRGRANCGPCFSGDEVVIKVKKSKEIGDSEKHIYRGRVVGILKRSVKRKAYTFLCRVDAYISHLMRPIDGIAPKIHVKNSDIRERTENMRDQDKRKEKMNELVAKYRLEDDELVLDKIVRLDPKRRRDMLFIVKYLEWNTDYMYPFGYVCGIISAGQGLEDSQGVLNILYQVPTRPNKECQEAALVLKDFSFDTSGRLDLRGLLTVTIDPSTCQDVDDALTLRLVKDDVFEVGVHIADVSQYVEIGSIIDKNAMRRVTSFYPATNKVYHMLPEALSENMCSLKEGVDRATLSVFIYINRAGKLLENKQVPQIMRTVIRNKKKMTYEQAQKIIDSHPLGMAWKDNNLDSLIVNLHTLAKTHRLKRLQNGSYFYQMNENTFATDSCHAAHRLIEEFMILANLAVANFLVKKFPDCAPVRRQKAPDGTELCDWENKFGRIIPSSLYFNQFCCLRSPNSQAIDETADNRVFVLMQTIEKLNKAVDKGHSQKIATLVGNEELHPKHILAMEKWWKIQETAEYVCYPDAQNQNQVAESSHFSLQIPHYVQFTSPIRRYMDLVVHRLVKAALDCEPSPYTDVKIKELCENVNKVNSAAKRYHNACILLEMTVLLKEPFYLPSIVEEFDDNTLTMMVPYLPHMKGRQRELKYSALSVNDKPTVNKNNTEVELMWEKRLYDAHPAASTKAHARSGGLARLKAPLALESDKHFAKIEPESWQNLQNAVRRNDLVGLQDIWNEIWDTIQMDQQQKTKRTEVTSEMRNNATMVRHLVKFTLTLKRGTVLGVQYGAESMNGFLQPVVKMVNLTHEKDLCIEHRNDQVKCFAELATEKVRPQYGSISEYQTVWLPILGMEAASKTVTQGDTIFCQNVPIVLKKTNDVYYGKLKLNIDFCKRRNLKIFTNSKEGEDESNDFLCIRFPFDQKVVRKTVKEKTVCEYESLVRNVWVGHAVATYVSVNEEKHVILKFKIQHSNSLPPVQLLEAGRAGKACTVEFLTKLLPDRRMEDAVKSIKEASELCQRIVLGQRVDDLESSIVWPKSDKYDIDVEQGTRIYRNNNNQADAIRTALQKPFTLIQGPPGTGKTVTGIKLVYWFTQMNRQSASGENHSQVLYCGPSNSSVDVAANWLKRLGKNCPKIVRVYSEVLENQIFPIPRDSMQGGSMKGRRYELIDKDENKDIALHHLIRQNGKQFAKRIKAFDRRFEQLRDHPEEISDEEVERYQKLITDAAIHELKSFDVILCTCAASASPRMVRGANVRQVIIDECGMCMEPECFVPLVSCKAIKQVVLIGDHKQLQPIVCNPVAKSLGLDISLFERYNDQAFMLDKQYRMNAKICEFPSKYFYKSKLKTPDKLYFNQARWQEIFKEKGIWPNIDYPMVFCHAEGAEKSLSVSTTEGNEASRSNELEMKEAVRIYLHMVNHLNVKPHQISILSQYKAQCNEIERNLESVGIELRNVSTVVASQGNEWDFVILSLVRSMPRDEIEQKPSIGWCQKNMGFIVDEHQINVALTRARMGLIIIGNKHLLRCNEMWKNLLEHFSLNKCVKDVKKFMPSFNRMNEPHIDEKFGNADPDQQQFNNRNATTDRFNQPFNAPPRFNNRP